jgi:hypothetical protein
MNRIGFLVIQTSMVLFMICYITFHTGVINMYLQFADKKHATVGVYISSLFFEYVRIINSPFDIDKKNIKNEGFFYVEDDTIKFATGDVANVPAEIPNDAFKLHITLEKEQAFESLLDNCTDAMFVNTTEQVLHQLFTYGDNVYFSSVVEQFAKSDGKVEGLVNRMINHSPTRITVH